MQIQQPTELAAAALRGGNGYPDLTGYAWFRQTPEGVLVTIRVEGLPTGETPCGGRFFALHIHTGSACTGNAQDAFADAGSHLNPGSCLHPYHAGDLPPLLGADGRAYSSFLTGRFTVEEIVGRVLILHENHDDFTTQPSGNARTKIACGVIRRIY